MATKDVYSLIQVEKTEQLNVNQWVYQTLRQSLLCGEIRPGVALTIRGLAEKLEVSPMPVREALQKLASEEAIEVKNNRRISVPVISRDKFKELFSLRVLLETHAAETALPFFAETQINELAALDMAIDKAFEQGDAGAGTLANQAFHRYLYAQCPVQVCLPMIESLWLQLGPFVRIGLNKLDGYYQHDRHHEALEAIRQRDSAALRAAIEADVRDGLHTIHDLDQIYQDLEIG